MASHLQTIASHASITGSRGEHKTTKKPSRKMRKGNHRHEPASGALLKGVIKALKASATTLTEEKKTGDGKTVQVRSTIYDRNLVKTSRSFFQASKPYRITLRSGLVVTSSAGGVINTTQKLDPSAGAAQDWSSLAAVFDVFRLRSIRVRVAYVKFSGDNSGFLYIATDFNSEPTPSVALMLDYDNVVLKGAHDFEYGVQIPTGTETHDWLATASPSNQVGAVMLYGEKWHTSNQTHEIIFDYDLEFAQQN